MPKSLAPCIFHSPLFNLPLPTPSNKSSFPVLFFAVILLLILIRREVSALLWAPNAASVLKIKAAPFNVRSA